MNCHEVEERITSYYLGDLNEAEALEVMNHIDSCESCRAVAGEIEPTLDDLRTALAADTGALDTLTENQHAELRSIIYGDSASSGAVDQAQQRPSSEPAESHKIIQWFLDPHPALTRAAAGIAILLVIATLLLPRMMSSRRSLSSMRIQNLDALSGLPMASSEADAKRTALEVTVVEPETVPPAAKDGDGMRDRWPDDANEANLSPDAGGNDGESPLRDHLKSSVSKQDHYWEIEDVDALEGQEPSENLRAGVYQLLENELVMAEEGRDGSEAAGPGGEKNAGEDDFSFGVADAIEGVTVTKSPVVMKGIYGARSSGSRGHEIQHRQATEPEEENGPSQVAAGPSRQDKAINDILEHLVLEDERREKEERASRRGQKSAEIAKESQESAISYALTPVAAKTAPPPETHARTDLVTVNQEVDRVSQLSQEEIDEIPMPKTRPPAKPGPGPTSDARPDIEEFELKEPAVRNANTLQFYSRSEKQQEHLVNTESDDHSFALPDAGKYYEYRNEMDRSGAPEPAQRGNEAKKKEGWFSGLFGRAKKSAPPAPIMPPPVEAPDPTADAPVVQRGVVIDDSRSLTPGSSTVSGGSADSDGDALVAQQGAQADYLSRPKSGEAGAVEPVQTVVLHRLEQRKGDAETVAGEDKVPFLGDIPLIGNFFRSERTPDAGGEVMDDGKSGTSARARDGAGLTLGQRIELQSQRWSADADANGGPRPDQLIAGESAGALMDQRESQEQIDASFVQISESELNGLGIEFSNGTVDSEAAQREDIHITVAPTDVQVFEEVVQTRQMEIDVPDTEVTEISETAAFAVNPTPANEALVTTYGGGRTFGEGPVAVGGGIIVNGRGTQLEEPPEMVELSDSLKTMTNTAISLGDVNINLFGELSATVEIPPDNRSGGSDESDKTEEEPEQLTGPVYKATGVNPFYDTAAQRTSTFGIDIDTAAYTLARRQMIAGNVPAAEAVRTEEFVNYFDYDYSPPKSRTFGINVELAPSPYGRGLQMMKVGIKAKRLGREEHRPAALTFVIDPSGSMNTPDRLGLVKKSLLMLVQQLSPSDRVAIVQYHNKARLVLDHTPASERDRIIQAISAMRTSGSTNLEEGIAEGYKVAARNFVPRGENRVLLLSDGVANLGSVEERDIVDQIEKYRAQGIRCSIYGFGIGTYNDVMLETLADKGDGVYAFVDSVAEAKRIFVDDLAATLNTVAGDTRIQVEFNPRVIARYRQLGYENRQMREEQFRMDEDREVQALSGEVGSGQSITSLYELELAESGHQPSRFQVRELAELRGEPLATVRVRYRNLRNNEMEEIEQKVFAHEIADRIEDASARFRLAAGVAEFAEIMRGSPHAAGSEYENVARLLRPVSLELSLDHRVQELLYLVENAKGMPRSDSW